MMQSECSILQRGQNNFLNLSWKQNLMLHCKGEFQNGAVDSKFAGSPSIISIKIWSLMKVGCKRCVFFKITWEKEHPYGCRAFGFKSKNLPSTEVLKAAGMECLKFSPKQIHNQ